MKLSDFMYDLPEERIAQTPVEPRDHSRLMVLHRDTGAMIESIGYARPTAGIESAKSIDIYPQGVDGKGVRNAEKAFILHYGTSKIPGSRWVDDADRYSEETAPEAMAAVWDRHNNGR